MATVVRTYWINPLTDSTDLPELPGDVFNAAVAYWEDEITEARAKRPRKDDAKREKDRLIQRASEKLDRYRKARDQYATDFRKLDKLTLQLATDDLREVMREVA